MLSRKIGIDLGTATVRIFVKGEGVVVNVMLVVEFALVGDAADLAEPAGRVCLRDAIPGHGAQHGASLGKTERRLKRIRARDRGADNGRRIPRSACGRHGAVGERQGLVGLIPYDGDNRTQSRDQRPTESKRPAARKRRTLTRGGSGGRAQ